MRDDVLHDRLDNVVIFFAQGGELGTRIGARLGSSRRGQFSPRGERRQSIGQRSDFEYAACKRSQKTEGRDIVQPHLGIRRFVNWEVSCALGHFDYAVFD